MQDSDSRRSTGRLSVTAVSVADLASVVEVPTEHYPHAAGIESGVVVYDAASLDLADPAVRGELAVEWAQVLMDGPGVYAVRGAFADTGVVDAATEVFTRIIAEERARGGDHGDHFGKPGANARIWNAQEKLARMAPEVFVDYFANDVIALGSRSWLGPGYQVTSQVNLVYPGGQAQQPHRDYHLGFQSNEVAEQYPAHVHRLSPTLTLQGVVAHCDMPVESGPTMLLPHSQKYDLGYLAWRDEGVKAYFADHMVQLPLAKGDVVFLSPALLHGAGSNRSADSHRLANLLQVSSAFGRAMESVNRLAMCEAIYPSLTSRIATGQWPARLTEQVIASCAEGYAFPTNLDLDQPVNGLAPASQADILGQALSEGWAPERLAGQLHAHLARTLP